MFNAQYVARVTRHCAAPMKDAITSFSSWKTVRVVAPSTAHGFAAINAIGRSITFTTFDSAKTNRCVGLTEGWRVLVVYEISARWRFLVRIGWYQIQAAALADVVACD